MFENLTFIPQIGATPFQNKTYWFNWQSNEQVALILCLIDIFFWESLEKSGHMLGIFSKVTGKIWRCTGYMLQRNDFSKSQKNPHIQVLRFLGRENGTGSLPETTAGRRSLTLFLLEIRSCSSCSFGQNEDVTLH